MDDNIIIKEPTAIERYVMCLEEQVATVTDALCKVQQENKELKSIVEKHMPIKAYSEYCLDGCNLSERFFVQLKSPQQINTLFVRDFFQNQNIHEFCMVSSYVNEPNRHVLEIAGMFRDYVYLSNVFNQFYDECKKAHVHTFTMMVMSMNRLADYLCTRFDIGAKQMVVQRTLLPQIYKFDEHTNQVECFYVDYLHPDRSYVRMRIERPVIDYIGMSIL